MWLLPPFKLGIFHLGFRGGRQNKKTQNQQLVKWSRRGFAASPSLEGLVWLLEWKCRGSERKQAIVGKGQGRKQARLGEQCCTGTTRATNYLVDLSRQVTIPGSLRRVSRLRFLFPPVGRIPRVYFELVGHSYLSFFLVHIEISKRTTHQTKQENPFFNSKLEILLSWTNSGN